MSTGIMITNDGPHSPAKWAVATAAQIVEIGTDATSTQAVEARKLELAIIGLLEEHHAAVQEGERGKIAVLGTERALDANEHVTVDDVVDDIVDASKGSIFEAHFAVVETQKYLADLIASHFATSMDIERKWHADRSRTTVTGE